jgi:predicted GNAT family acetyltransferase
VEALLACAGGFLAAREAEHNLILGLSSRLKDDSNLYGVAPYLATVEDNGHVVAVGFRTPPHNLALSEVNDLRACVLLADDVASMYASLRGVVGPVAAVDEFVSLWSERTGAKQRFLRKQRIYRAASVLPPDRPPGRMRPYEPRDRDICVRWLAEFVAEAFGPTESPPPENAEGILDQRLSEPEGGIVLWDDTEPVSLAGYGGPTPNGIRIGPIYTPPAFRRRGFASALVADLTASLLEQGRRFCFLYTDLANPTSNSIYQHVGYQPITDAREALFAESA